MSLDYFATQSGSYTAEVTRRAVFAWAARTAANSPGIIAGGLLSSSDLQVTAPASGMSVNIGAGEAIIGGTEGGAQGGYTIRNSATYSAPVAAANATNPRIDAVVATMADSGYTQPSDVGATTNGAVLAVVTGTPTSGASLSNLSGAPAIPASSLLLAYLLVPAGATNIVSGDISNRAKVVTPGFFGTTSIGDGQPMVYNGTTGQWRTLPAGGGNATFLQLLSSQTLQLAAGQATVTFSGSSASVTVTHSLGRVPTIALAMNNNEGGGVNETAAWSLTSSTTTQATFLGYIANGFSLSGSVTLYWLAIG